MRGETNVKEEERERGRERRKEKTERKRKKEKTERREKNKYNPVFPSSLSCLHLRISYIASKQFGSTFPPFHVFAITTPCFTVGYFCQRSSIGEDLFFIN